ncbi:GroES-like protein [Xylariaceae sp. FL0255]|nr:GroES-like protein [Xylariaceae sp. FL0255]
MTTDNVDRFDPRDKKICLNDIPIPEPKPHEILVKVACASLCHTDTMWFDPNEALQLSTEAKPVTLGHEASGTVVGVGPAVKDFKISDPVGFLCTEGSCFECRACKEVHNFWCEKGQQSFAGFGQDGYFQEYVAVNAKNAMVLPDGLSPSDAAPLFCAGVTAYHGIDDLQLPAGSWVAVVGCGGLGHLGIKYAKAMGYKVIGVDITDAAIEEAKASGAEHAFNTTADNDYAKKIVDITGGGVDAAVNFTASGQSYADTPQLIRTGGIFMAVGIPKDPVPINIFHIAMGKFQLRGSNNGTCYNMRAAIEFSAKYGIKPTIEYHTLEQLPDMVDKMLSHKARGRMAVRFD